VLRVGLVGCGVMGRRHAAVVAADDDAELVCAVDIVASRARAVAARHGATPRWVPEVDLVIIATPTACHVPLARPLLDQGHWVLVEKPVAASPAAARELEHPRCLVGHCERFNPAIRAAAVHRPSALQIWREGPWSGRSADIDVLADLMVHDLDLLLRWGRDLRCTSATGHTGPSGRLDRVQVELEGSELQVQLVADRMARARRRQVVGRDARGELTLDLVQGSANRAGRPVPRVDDHDALTAQWLSVRQHVEGRVSDQAVARVGEARDALQLAHTIRERIQAR